MLFGLLSDKPLNFAELFGIGIQDSHIQIDSTLYNRVRERRFKLLTRTDVLQINVIGCLHSEHFNRGLSRVDGKLSRTVLRGKSGSNARDLPGIFLRFFAILNIDNP